MSHIKGINGIQTSLLVIEVEDLKKYTNIGFCQPKFYTTTAWNRAKKCMKRLCELGYVEAYDYGRGKGKYTTTQKCEDEDIAFAEIYLKLVEDNFVIGIRKR